MSNNRKIQGDIDKLVKKITEGIEEYEVIYDKFAEAATPALKERFEGDLKKEIKKLQRLRETVKGLVQSAEVKDKKQLEQARRRVEEKMEAFKVVERETKTKAFSKEGLANQSSNNAETPQQRTENWIKNFISDLMEQVETAEFELQAEGGGSAGGAKRGGGKKKKEVSDDPREIRIIRLRTNTLKLEQLLRMVVNEDLQPDEVDEIEDDVARFVDDNNEEDFEEDLELYDRFDLPDVTLLKKATDSDNEDEDKKKATPATPASAPPAAAAGSAKKKGPDTPPSAATKTPLAPAAAATKAAVAATPQTAPPSASNTAPTVASPNVQKKDAVVHPSLPSTTTTPITAPAATAPAATPFAKKSVAAVVAAAAAASNPAAAKEVPKPATAPAAAAPKAMPTSFAAAAAAAAGNSTPITTSKGTPMSTPTLEQTFPSRAQTSASLGSFGGGGGVDLDDGLGDDGLDDLDDNNDDTFGDDAIPVNNTASLADMALNTKNMAARGGVPSEWEKQRATRSAGLPPTPMSGGQQQHGGIVPPRSVNDADLPNNNGIPVAPQPAALSPQQPVSASSSSATPNVWSALLKGQQPSEEKVAMHRMLDMSLGNLPHPHDVERVRAFVPPNPYATKPHNPQTVHPGFSLPEMFRRFDPDTLFFIFYYQQQTYQQYLAAKELKRQSFRYHKKFKTWFQRHDKPKESNEEYESGAYLYFDYENGWCQRIKNDFMFKYTYLEDELV